MLTEAGDTFHQKDNEIESMKKMLGEYEDKLKQQVRLRIFLSQERYNLMIEIKKPLGQISVVPSLMVS